MNRTGSRTPAELRAMVRKRDGDNCSLCRTPINFSRAPGTEWGPSLEHVIPLAAGGTNDLDNLRLAHAYPCNKAKADFGADPADAERHLRKIGAAIAQAHARARRLRSQSGVARSRPRDLGQRREVRRAASARR